MIRLILSFVVLFAALVATAKAENPFLMAFNNRLAPLQAPQEYEEEAGKVPLQKAVQAPFQKAVQAPVQKAEQAPVQKAVLFQRAVFSRALIINRPIGPLRRLAKARRERLAAMALACDD